MTLWVFLEQARNMSGEGFDDIEMVDIMNKVIFNVNAQAIEGLLFKPVSRCNTDYLYRHKLSCLIKQEDREAINIILPGMIAEIKKIDDDYNAYLMFKQEYDDIVQNYKAKLAMVDLTGHTDTFLAFDIPDSFTEEDCSCAVMTDYTHNYDHFHDLKLIGVNTDKHLTKAMAKGVYKRHNAGNNGEHAIEHRAGHALPHVETEYMNEHHHGHHHHHGPWYT